MGYAAGRLIAYVMVVTSIGKEHDVAGEARRMEKVAETVMVYSEYDVVMRIEAENFKDIDRIVTRIRSIPHVLRTVTLIGEAQNT